MVWNGTKVNEVLLYCETPKTRDQIKEKFGMSDIESWHCVKFLSKLKGDVKVEKRAGATGRAYKYKTRNISIEQIKLNYDDGRYEKSAKDHEKILEEEISEDKHDSSNKKKSDSLKKEIATEEERKIAEEADIARKAYAEENELDEKVKKSDKKAKKVKS